jgi:Flp pilus assembly protein TadG
MTRWCRRTPLSQRKAAPRRGATSVEFAVVSLIFFTFILATVELGRGLMVSSQLANTARRACRTAVPAGRSNNDIQTTANTALQQSGLPATNVVVLVNGVQADASTAQSGDRITVNVTLPVSQVSWIPGSRYLSGNLAGTYSLRRE